MAAFVQWIHLAAAVVGVGGMGFLHMVLIPSLRALEPEHRDTLMRKVLPKFRYISWTVIFLLLASGLYKVNKVWEVPSGHYWIFLSLKIILALVIFGISFCLTIPLPFFDRFRMRRQMWLSIAFTTAMIVILISAYLSRGVY